MNVVYRYMSVCCVYECPIEIHVKKVHEHRIRSSGKLIRKCAIGSEDNRPLNDIQICRGFS